METTSGLPLPMRRVFQINPNFHVQSNSSEEMILSTMTRLPKDIHVATTVTHFRCFNEGKM